MKSNLSTILETGAAAITFVILAVYGYALLFEIPYLGFVAEPPENIIYVREWGENPSQTLQPGDVLVQVNGLDWTVYTAVARRFVFSSLTQDAPVNLLVQRDGSPVSVVWDVPGINIGEFIYRLLSAWWLPYTFWLAGIVASLLVRPKDTCWQLLYPFFYLIALGLSAGAVSPYGYLYSTHTLRTAVWLILPISWHLHWLFPRPLGSTPKRFLVFLYLIATALALAEWLNLVPPPAFLIGFLLIVLNSAALIVTHALEQADVRRGLGFLATSVLVVTLPTVVIVLVTLLLNNNEFYQYINYTVFLLPGIPFAYLYIIYRGWAGEMELRANRLITIIIYSGLLLSMSVLLAFLSTAIFQDSGYHLSIGIALTFFMGLVTVYAYPQFQRWVDRRLLGIPVPPTQLLERYSARITTSLGADDMIRLLRDDVFPSLLVRQASLLRLDASAEPVVLFTIGVTQEQLPKADQLPSLLMNTGIFPRPNPNGHQDPCPWVLLVLPLSVGGQTIGCCFLGRRDPDDNYSRAEISTLQALMDQTALALVNIEQADRLRALYQKDIERQELERSHLARELHDDVLNQLGILWMSVDERQAGEQFAEAYQTSVHRIREIISGLRPGMLMYGLRFALEELTEETATQVGGDISIQLDVPPSDIRYPPDVELHLFRIVQQACQNALKHSQAQRIYIRGKLEAECVEVMVEDDGVGFIAGKNLDLPRLLVNKHFGLAGMHERAALIGAQMQIDSGLGKGTRVKLVWRG